MRELLFPCRQSHVADEVFCTFRCTNFRRLPELFAGLLTSARGALSSAVRVLMHVWYALSNDYDAPYSLRIRQPYATSIQSRHEC